MKGCVLVLLLLLSTLVAQADPRQWNHTGIPIHQGSFLDWDRTSVKNAAGNTLLLWSDTRTGNRDIYAQLVSPAGVPLWAAGGINVTNCPGHQFSPAACAVSGGWIIAWIEFRPEPGWRLDEEEPPPPSGGVHAIRLDDNGNPTWPSGGIPVDTTLTDAVDGSLHMVPDGTGGAILVWLDIRPPTYGAVYAQRLMSGGQHGWNNSLAVGTANTNWYGVSLSADVDGSGNMLLAWDGRDSTYHSFTCVAKVTLDGQLPWGGSNGVRVCSVHSWQRYAQICSDGAGGAFVAWADDRSSIGRDLYIQRFNPIGIRQWDSIGVALCSAGRDQTLPRIALSTNNDSPDGCLAVWEDQRVNGAYAEIYAQKMSPQGSPLWTANGIKVCGDAADSTNPQGHSRYEPQVVSDLSGGLVCAWHDTRASSGDESTCDLYAGHVRFDGSLAWNGENGAVVANGALAQNLPALQVDNSTVLIAYNDCRVGSASLRLQRLSLPYGSRMLADTGTVVYQSDDQDTRAPKAFAMSGGRTALVWSGQLGYVGTLLYYQIINNSGQNQLPAGGVPLVPDFGTYANQENIQLCSDGSGGFIVVYEDLRTGAKRIRMQHVNSAGEIGCGASAMPIWSDDHTSDQIRAYCAPDGDGGCYVAWSNYDQNYYLDAYVLRMDSHGNPVWPRPVRLTDTNDDDLIYGIVSDQDFNCTIVWKSGNYGDFNVSAAKLQRDGSVVYNRAVCDAAEDQDNPSLVADGFGGAYFVWLDERPVPQHPGWSQDVYVQRLTAQGTDYWTHNGIPVVQDSTYQNDVSLIRGADGNVFITWAEYLSDTVSQLSAQKMSPSGSFLWPGRGVLAARTNNVIYSQCLVPDNGAGLFLVWQDDYTYSDQSSIFGTHLDGEGNPAGDSYWVAGQGGRLCDAGNGGQYYPVAVSDGCGGVIAAWDDRRCNMYDYWWGIYAQHISDAAGAKDKPSLLPKAYALSQNYPNPFNPSTVISFALPKAGLTTLKVYDLLGREVTTLVNRSLAAGNHHVSFDGSTLASGLYFYRIESGTFTATKKMVLLK